MNGNMYGVRDELQTAAELKSKKVADARELA
jgi:hypothetical protein